jgi:UDP-N-acetylmuramate dehydrogenase
VGGTAQALFVPEDEADLAFFLGALPSEIPVTVVGLGSNLIVRDGGVPGVVIRLGRGFGEVKIESGSRIRVGAAVPDVKVSRMAQEAAIAGLAFFRGIPGAIGGALRMNGGAYGRETKDAVIEVRGVDRRGRAGVFTNCDMNYSYRHCGLSEDIIFTEALFQGAPGEAQTIAAEMDKITEARETTQPIKSRTGGSTFKNPPGPSCTAIFSSIWVVPPPPTLKIWVRPCASASRSSPASSSNGRSSASAWQNKRATRRAAYSQFY